MSLLTHNQLQNFCKRGKLTRVRTAGRGRKGLIEWSTIPESLREPIISKHGDPYSVDVVDRIISRLNEDEKASATFAKEELTESQSLQYYTEAKILNLWGELLDEYTIRRRNNPSFRTSSAKKEICEGIQQLKTITYPNSNTLRFPHKLPSNPRALDRKYREYKSKGYESLIHKGTGNSNRNKIGAKNGDWILGFYSLPHKPTVTTLHEAYQQIAAENGWPKLTYNTIYKWLQEPTQKKKWSLARQGEEFYKKQFGHKISRDRSGWFPNAYLAIDGSKLDWIHFEEGATYNMAAKLKIDVVFDVYSERILGYYCGDEHENFTQHFKAIKMALNETQVKPTLITYDNQGGHKTQPMQELYNRIVTQKGGTHYPHRANEHSSPVEGLFSRFQQQMLNQIWWSDKQAINVRKEDSRPNMDFVRENRHKLKSKEYLIEAFDYYVQKWNEAPHPKFKDQSRNEVANHSCPIELDPVTQLDFISLFWITSKDPLTYTSTGFMPMIRGEKYHFEVYDAEGNVDLDFRDMYTGCKFFYQYDPDQLDSYIRLHLRLPNGNMKYIADAQPIKKVKTIPALMTPEDHQHKNRMIKVRDQEKARIEQEIEGIRSRTNLTPEKLIEDQELELKQCGRIPKRERETAEAQAGSWTSKL